MRFIKGSPAREDGQNAGRASLPSEAKCCGGRYQFGSELCFETLMGDKFSN
jgi:hypothetical protein